MGSLIIKINKISAIFLRKYLAGFERNSVNMRIKEHRFIFMVKFIVDADNDEIELIKKHVGEMGYKYEII